MRLTYRADPFDGWIVNGRCASDSRFSGQVRESVGFYIYIIALETAHSREMNNRWPR